MAYISHETTHGASLRHRHAVAAAAHKLDADNAGHVTQQATGMQTSTPLALQLVSILVDVCVVAQIRRRRLQRRSGAVLGHGTAAAAGGGSGRWRLGMGWREWGY
jgi:hypothetical protein